MTTEEQRKKALEWFNNLCAWTISRWPDERMEYVETIRTALLQPSPQVMDDFDDPLPHSFEETIAKCRLANNTNNGATLDSTDYLFCLLHYAQGYRKAALSAPVQCEAVGNEYCWRHDRPGKECAPPEKTVCAVTGKEYYMVPVGEPVQCVPEEAIEIIEAVCATAIFHSSYKGDGFATVVESRLKEALILLKGGGEK